MKLRPSEEVDRKSDDEVFIALARVSLIHFIRIVAPWYTIEEFHLLLAKKLEECADGKNDRLMVFAPPRAGKSSMIWQFFMAWWFGRFPGDQVMGVSHNVDLAAKHGMLAREIMESPLYRRIFPYVWTDPRRKAGKRWVVTSPAEWEEEEKKLREQAKGDPEAMETLLKQGSFMAAGQRTGLAGHGFNLGLVDDPISEHDAESDKRIQSVNEWWGPGFYTRRQPERNVIIIIMTRWRDDDLCGYLLGLQKRSKYSKRRWQVLSISATVSDKVGDLFAKISLSRQGRAYCSDVHGPDICDCEKPIGQKGCKGGMRPAFLRSEAQPLVSFAPRRWPIEELLDTRDMMNNEDKWNALYQQKPRKKSGQILPVRYWKKWDQEKYGPVPFIEYTLTSVDGAFEPNEESDYSALTHWGVFYNQHANMHHMMLLWAERGKWTFPEFREFAWQHYKSYRPDRMIIEKKASGHSLIQELRMKNVPVQPYTPPGGVNAVSKHTRAMRAGDIMKSGAMWLHPDPSREEQFAEVVEECDKFPSGDYDDYVDTISMATTFLRNTFWIQTSDDDRVHKPSEEEILQQQIENRKHHAAAYA